MTLQAPSWLQNGLSYSARTDRLANTDILFETPGVIRQSDLRVTPTTPASMSVTVGSGQAIVPGNRIAQQGHYTVTNLGPENVTIPAANASNPRIDIIILEVLDSEVSGTQNTARFRVISGTPASSPSAPSVPKMAISVAQITVGRGAGSINSGSIDNNRRHRATLHRSIGGGSAIPVANATERDFLLTQYSGISKSNPLIVYRQNAAAGRELEISTNGKSFTTVNPPVENTGWQKTFLNMSSGWKNHGSTSQTKIRRIGDRVFMNLYITRTGGTISSSNIGNVKNTTVAVLRPPWRPDIWQYGFGRERFGMFIIYASGEIVLTSVGDTNPIRKGDTFIIHANYFIDW